MKCKYDECYNKDGVCLVNCKETVANEADEMVSCNIVGSKYGGTLTDVSKLADDTLFYVNNGAWRGCVFTEDGVKKLVCLDAPDGAKGGGEITDDDKYFWITLLDGTVDLGTLYTRLEDGKEDIR